MYSFEEEKHIALIPSIVVVKRVGIEVPLVAVPVQVHRNHVRALRHLYHCRSERPRQGSCCIVCEIINLRAQYTYCIYVL